MALYRNSSESPPFLEELRVFTSCVLSVWSILCVCVCSVDHERDSGERYQDIHGRDGGR